MWREDSVKCIEVVKGETTLSCLFKSCRGTLNGLSLACTVGATIMKGRCWGGS